mgnify:CR=1 FL=1
MANLLDSASILLTPTAYNNGSILAIQPSDGSGDMTFSRGSSATRVNAQGLIEDIASNLPRIDYTDGCGSLLLEPQSTNLVTYSEDFNGSGWSNTGTTITENQSISPDGSLNADLIELDSNLDRLAAVLGSTGGTYTFSFYIKAKEGESGVWRTRVNGDSTLWQNTQVNDTEWTRVTQTFTKTGSGNIVVYPAYRVDGTSTLFNAYIFGAQLEAGSYATSYIPTQGVISTRLADIATNSGIGSLIGQTEGTIFLDSKMALQSINNYQLFSINNASGVDRIRILTATAGRLRFIYQLNSGVSYSFYNPTDYSDLTSLKIAFTYKSGDIKVYINGVLVDSSTNTFTIAQTLTNIDFATSSGRYNQMLFNSVQLYKTALTDAQLTALTTI